MTPSALVAHGYRLEYGDPNDPTNQGNDPPLADRYWWTWSNGSGIDCSEGTWIDPNEAIADAQRDLQEQLA